MKLRIRKHSSVSKGQPVNHLIGSFTDLDSLAREVARDVKTWARQVPLRKQYSRFTLELFAEWTEPAKTKKPK